MLKTAALVLLAADALSCRPLHARSCAAVGTKACSQGEGSQLGGSQKP